MGIQTFYPVFENGQVLTSEFLNDIIDYLEPQDRESRRRLTGIGIVCGLKPDLNTATGTLQLSRGVAVTSEGYLIEEEETTFDRVRDYTVPIPSGPDATPEDKAKARYPFLFDGQTQRAALELLPVDFVPAAGEAPPRQLTPQIVADSSVLLFLEVSLESLKNCDVNDCSDKGSEMNLTLRRLLVSRNIANTILNDEEAIAARPVERASHPRLTLPAVVVPKVNPAGNGIQSLPELYARFLVCASFTVQQLMPAMDQAWQAYRPVLEGMFPPDRFPEGPIPRHHFLNMVGVFAERPVLAQYLYDATSDIAQSYREFVSSAARFDVECCPDGRRFPHHVLAGDVVARPTSFSGGPQTLADYSAYEPLGATGGPAPQGQPDARRHYFIPSPAVDAGSERAAELRALFSRMVLLAQTYSTRDLLRTDVRLTPSREGDAPLGERAIPFYYRFERGGDLFLNWSWRKAREFQTASIFSHQFSEMSDRHPFLMRQDDQDFIRIEGAVGKPLGTTMLGLIEQKRRLGLNFAIDPIWIGSSRDSGKDAGDKALAARAVQQLVLCRMRDLDVIFLMIMGALFSFLVWLVQTLGRLEAIKTGRRPLPVAPQPAPPVVSLSPAIRAASFINLDRLGEARLRAASERVLSTNRAMGALAGDAVRTLVEAADATPVDTAAVSAMFDRVRDPGPGGELSARLRIAISDLNIGGDLDELTAVAFPAVALMAQAETLMRYVSVPSLAEFDEPGFDAALRGFADAYDTYAAKAETDATRVPKQVVDANLAIIEKRGFVGAASTQFNSAAITSELGRRLASMFEDLTFSGFARRHPGMEHKSGVPVGGTLALVYGSRRDLEGLMREAIDEVGDVLGGLKLIDGPPPAADFRRAIEELKGTSAPASEDILDQFVVLGDFCLPYLCCDGDCSDNVVDRRIGRKEGMVRLPSDPVPPRMFIMLATPVSIAQPVASTVPAPGPAPGGDTPTAPTPAAPIPTAPTPVAPTLVVTPGPVPVRTGSVEITVVSRLGRREMPMRLSTLTMVVLETNKRSSQVLTDPVTTLDLKPGKYSFMATSGASSSAPVDVAVGAGEQRKIKLVVG